jgi:hypothetical protein
MIDAAAVGEIIAQYQKHGWTFRRALLSPNGKTVLTRIVAPEQIVRSDLDALWFSRASKPDSEAWELRRLTGPPFALVAVVSTGIDNEELESTLEQVAAEMREKTIA